MPRYHTCRPDVNCVSRNWKGNISLPKSAERVLNLFPRLQSIAEFVVCCHDLRFVDRVCWRRGSRRRRAERRERLIVLLDLHSVGVAVVHFEVRTGADFFWHLQFFLSLGLLKLVPVLIISELFSGQFCSRVVSKLSRESGLLMYFKGSDGEEKRKQRVSVFDRIINEMFSFSQHNKHIRPFRGHSGDVINHRRVMDRSGSTFSPQLSHKLKRIVLTVWIFDNAQLRSGFRQSGHH